MVKKLKNNLEEGPIYCATCNCKMKETILPIYEYLDGYPLKNVSTFKCPKCREIFFTEAQVANMEKRTIELRQSIFGFERIVSKSGKSLVVSIPYEIAEHFNIKRGEKIKVIPLVKDGFIIKLK